MSQFGYLSEFQNRSYDCSQCFLFGDDPPTTFDPILNIKELEIKTAPAQISISWNDIRQAKLYTLFENGKKIYAETQENQKICFG